MNWIKHVICISAFFVVIWIIYFLTLNRWNGDSAMFWFINLMLISFRNIYLPHFPIHIFPHISYCLLTDIKTCIIKQTSFTRVVSNNVISCLHLVRHSWIIVSFVSGSSRVELSSYNLYYSKRRNLTGRRINIYFFNIYSIKPLMR